MTEKRYAILDTATNAVANVAVFDIPDGGTMHDSGGGQYWVLDANGSFLGSYKPQPGCALVALADGAFCEPGANQQPDGSFVRPQA